MGAAAKDLNRGGMCEEKEAEVRGSDPNLEFAGLQVSLKQKREDRAP